MRNKRPSPKRRAALIPRVVFGTVFAGVVPAVVTGGFGCGSDSTNKTPDAQYYGVGAPCCSVAAIFEAGPDRADGATDGAQEGATDAPGDTTEAG